MRCSRTETAFRVALSRTEAVLRHWAVHEQKCSSLEVPCCQRTEAAVSGALCCLVAGKRDLSSDGRVVGAEITFVISDSYLCPFGQGFRNPVREEICTVGRTDDWMSGVVLFRRRRGGEKQNTTVVSCIGRFVCAFIQALPPTSIVSSSQ